MSLTHVITTLMEITTLATTRWILSFLLGPLFGFAIMPTSLDHDLQLCSTKDTKRESCLGQKSEFREPGNVTDIAPALLELAPSSVTATPCPSDAL